MILPDMIIMVGIMSKGKEAAEHDQEEKNEHGPDFTEGPMPDFFVSEIHVHSLQITDTGDV